METFPVIHYYLYKIGTSTNTLTRKASKWRFQKL